MRLSIITPMYRRHGVFRIWCKAIKAAANASGLDVRVMVAGSEGEVSRALVEEWAGFDYVETPNTPLGAKFNAACMAAKEQSPDYVLILGSDNIICTRYLKAFAPKMKRGIDFIAHSDTYSIDLVGKRSLYWPGYASARRGEAVGSGRFFSKRLLNALEWQPWAADKNSSLDHSCNLKLRNIKHTSQIMQIKKMGIFHTGMKSGNDKNNFGLFNNSQTVRLQWLLDKFTTPEVRQDIYLYKR